MTFDQWRRGVGTAISFTAFGLGGLVIGLFIAPILLLVVRNQSRRQHMTRKLIRQSFRGFIGLMRVMGVAESHMEGAHRLHRPGLLIMGNHPSLIDVIYLVALTPNANCIVNGHLARNIFTRGPIKAAGYITNSDPQGVLEEAKASLAAGYSLILFPEGTRTTPGQPIRFRRGGANIALHSGTPITPVLISCTPTTLTKGEPWYHIPAHRICMEFRVLEDQRVPLDPDHAVRHQARAVTAWLTDYFNKELEQFSHDRDTRPLAGSQTDDYRHSGA